MTRNLRMEGVYIIMEFEWTMHMYYMLLLCQSGGAPVFIYLQMQMA
jgi:hypothetical protein